MTRRNLFSQMFLPVLVVLLVALGLSMWVSVHILREFHLRQTALQLENYAHLVELQLDSLPAKGQTEQVQAQCESLARLLGIRITVILPTGEVIADSNENPSEMENHADREEVKQALAGKTGFGQRYSTTLQTNWFYVAIPQTEEGAVSCAIRTSTSLASINGALRDSMFQATLCAAAVTLCAALVVLLIARRISRPLRQMEAGVGRFADGDLDARLQVPESEELGGLATAVNTMADQLRDRIRTTERQRNELDALLASMSEGIIALDMAQNIVWLNQPAAALLSIDPKIASGRSLQEVVRNRRLHECVQRVIAEECPVQDEVVLPGTRERTLLVSVAPLRRDQSDVGLLLVLNDVTHLRALERVRSDFVANVSHEIKTPLTSIKGYIETLLNDPAAEQETRTRFLEIVSRQAERLSTLVDDILSLANLERAEIARDAPLERAEVRPIIQCAVHACLPQAEEKAITIAVDCPEGLFVHANAPLLEQALINLIDNACKYSHRESRVDLIACRAEEGVTISVTDKGIGIASEHLPRIFERFYRVDRARSRNLGGTGLGLAIVKHIAALHHGRVTVESNLNRGSCFTLHIPPCNP